MFERIDENTTVLTPNRRLAATLHQEYQQYQHQNGRTVWQTPDILPLQSWLQRLFHDCTHQSFDPFPLLLNDIQERFLWGQVLSSINNVQELLQVSKTIDVIQSAFGLIQQWQIDLQNPLFDTTADYQLMRQAALRFEQHCQKKFFLAVSSLPDFLILTINKKKIIPAKRLILAGFTEISPQLNKLLECCKTVGSTVEFLLLNNKNKSCVRQPFINPEDELLAMARFAKSKSSENSAAKIACIVPALDKTRDQVIRIFSEVFSVNGEYFIPLSSRPFNISAGKNLARHPIIHTALSLLSMPLNKISYSLLSYVLLSPFLGEAEKERYDRSRFDYYTRQKNIQTITLSELISEKFSISKHCPQLAKRLNNFYMFVLQIFESKLTYKEWAHHFHHMLTLLGWPGEKSLQSEEYQIIESWIDIFNAYQSLDQIAPPVSYKQALLQLDQLAQEKIFQAKSPETRIQILGTLEAAGIPFDYVWIAGMDDMTWPPSPKPNPFIPKSLQRQLHMPHASAERELTFCKELIEQFKKNASHLVLSYAEKKDDLTRKPSPLISDIPEESTGEISFSPHIRPHQLIYASKIIEYFYDEHGPTYTEKNVKGGISVIKSQALCPFKAFAEWRLHARQLEKPLPGLSEKERGIILHKTLEKIWQTLKCQADLQNMNASNLNELITQSIDYAMDFMHYPHNAKTYFSLEKKRLNQLILNWLDNEKKRPSFKISAIEMRAEINLGKLNYAIRIDRIDELDHGKMLMIDYKMSKNNEISSWFSNRPEEPQLPLYALLNSDAVAGIAFAELFPGETRFKGISQDQLEIDGVKPFDKKNKLSWTQQLNEWSTIFYRLSDDFYNGIAKIDPKNHSQTCLYCSLKPLCRINENIEPPYV